ncbi:Maf family protein [Paraliomyxa miuraensis]|uniref:Maf family protein n=1 Tax=Paraliomyxa miuraensis TaxID=376150 RepID=UPI00224E4D4C|nr:Maf family protein [Paraliomyxa miuraensis]MCX4239307.1 Maf family protein [Paraliomyxa miuraensis]
MLTSNLLQARRSSPQTRTSQLYRFQLLGETSCSPAQRREGVHPSSVEGPRASRIGAAQGRRLDDAAFALKMARGKARSLAERHPERWILAADQIAVLPGPPRRLLDKPGHPEVAVEHLMALSGRTHDLTTGVVLLHPARGREHHAIDQQRLTLRAFDRQEAETYVRRHRPLECAGSHRIEDAGIKLFERIEGQDYTGIMGLPLLAVARLLREVGVL